MAAGTVAYTDTTGNRDYLGMIAGQIGRRLREASDMASDERAYAERKAEEGGTSLDEAGIGKGYFFKRALGSRFGGDRIARTKGRMGMGGAGTNPTGNFKTRFRGGFDYNVTNEIQASTLPLSSALSAGLRGVEGGLVEVGRGIDALAVGLGNLARAQEDMAKQAVFNGAFMQAFLNHMQREGARQRARSEEAGLERGRLTGSGRGMINVTAGGGSGSGGGRGGFLGKGLDTFQTGLKAGVNPKSTKLLKSAGAATGLVKGTQTAIKNSDKLLKGSSAITGDVMSNADIVKAGVSGADNAAVKAFAKYGVRGTGAEIFKSKAGADALIESIDDANFIKFADDLKGLGNEDVLRNALLSDEFAYSTAGMMTKDDAYKFMGAIADGSFDGVARNGEEAAAMFKYLHGPEEYARNFGNLADVPIDTALKGTVTDQVVKQASKNASKVTAKAIGRGIWKKIPLIAGIAGIAFGIQRALEGDLLGAGLEITSGILGATGVGAKLSLGLDGYLLARDLGLTPLATGGITSRPTTALIGEAGKEGVFPLEGARGKKTFRMFGEGVLDAQEDNKNAVATMYAMGNKKYFDDMGGWSRFGEKIGNFLKGVKENTVGAEDDGYYGPSWLGIKNWNHPKWQNDADNPNKENVTAMSGSGGSLNLSEQDFKWLAYAVSGEARLGTKDEFAVAASILNRAARGDHGGSIEAIIKAPGQYEAYEKGMMNHNPEILNRLMSPSGQASIVDALRRLDGRTDFKGQTQLHNRVAGEDPMFHRLGNFFHYDYQTGPNSMRPSNYQTPNYQKFIKSSNTGGDSANLLQMLSAQNSMGSMFMPTTIINNNYAAVNGGGGGSEDTFGGAFPTGFAAFAPYYSLASK